MKNDSNALIQGITYTKHECYQYRQSVIETVSYELRIPFSFIVQVREITCGIMFLEINYTPKQEVPVWVMPRIIHGVFTDVYAPKFWEIKLLNIMHYHTEGEGGYVGYCGNVFYDRPDYDPSYYPEDPGFKRYPIKHEMLDTEQIYAVIKDKMDVWSN
ncbi:MAG: hypothetical protein NXI08_10740 [bacterium]|nr:hypothetical protein [bacterium]